MQSDTKRAELTLQMAFLTCAVRALMASHPKPDALRQCWNKEMATLWANHSAVMAGQENPLRPVMEKLQAGFESQLPTS
jgi:hypothetical protein